MELTISIGEEKDNKLPDEKKLELISKLKTIMTLLEQSDDEESRQAVDYVEMAIKTLDPNSDLSSQLLSKDKSADEEDIKGMDKEKKLSD